MEIDQTLFYALLIGVLVLGVILTVAEYLGLQRRSRPLAVFAVVVSVGTIVWLDSQPQTLERWGVMIIIGLMILVILLAIGLRMKGRKG